MAIAFQNWFLKHPSKTFLAPNLRICYFCTKLCILKNSKVLTPNMAIVFFKFWPKCTQIVDILAPNWNCFGFTWIFFTLTNSRVLILNMTIVSFKIGLKNTQIMYFSFQFQVFNFAWNIAYWQIWKCWFQMWQYFF